MWRAERCDNNESHTHTHTPFTMNRVRPATLMMIIIEWINNERQRQIFVIYFHVSRLWFTHWKMWMNYAGKIVRHRHSRVVNARARILSDWIFSHLRSFVWSLVCLSVCLPAFCKSMEVKCHALSLALALALSGVPSTLDDHEQQHSQFQVSPTRYFLLNIW